jgi:hypothetical protein
VAQGVRTDGNDDQPTPRKECMKENLGAKRK